MVIKATVVFGQGNGRADIVNGEVVMASYISIANTFVEKRKKMNG